MAKREITQAEIDNYIKGKGVRCFVCGEIGEIEGGFVEVNEGGATQEVNCLCCGASWTDLYKLDTVVDIDLSEVTEEEPQTEDESTSSFLEAFLTGKKYEACETATPGIWASPTGRHTVLDEDDGYPD